MHPSIPILDHGYLRLVETWGHGDANEPEAGIIEAARMSTQGSFRGWSTDLRLLRYLHTHRHTGPFEFAGATIEIQAPVFVARQWQRHRTQSYNEASARYAPLPELDHLPTADRVLLGGGHLTKQAASLNGATLTRDAAESFVAALARQQQAARAAYTAALASGVPLELARSHLTSAAYTRFRASANLLNWLRFLSLRNKPDAQWEIRQYAIALEDVLAAHFPRTLSLHREIP